MSLLYSKESNVHYLNDGFTCRTAESCRQQADDLSADEEEDDPAERAVAAAADTSALDKQLCTFVETQRDFKQQHW